MKLYYSIFNTGFKQSLINNPFKVQITLEQSQIAVLGNFEYSAQIEPLNPMFRG